MTTKNYIPYNKSDFFFTKNSQFTTQCSSDGKTCWGINSDNSKVTDSNGNIINITTSNKELLDPINCNSTNTCSDILKKQLIYNNVLYNSLINFQKNNQESNKRLDDLENKYNQDIFVILMYSIGLIFILTILYKL